MEPLTTGPLAGPVDLLAARRLVPPGLDRFIQDPINHDNLSPQPEPALIVTTDGDSASICLDAPFRDVQYREESIWMLLDYSGSMVRPNEVIAMGSEAQPYGVCFPRIAGLRNGEASDRRCRASMQRGG